METLNLNTLANSLPNAQQKAEQELLNNFKAAALSITTLYRSSRQNAKRAYNAGYAAACQDLLTMIQAGVSVGGLAPSASCDELDADNDGMTIGRVMDWTEARLEAIKAQEEEEDEEEEREREKDRPRFSSAVPANHSKSNVPAQTASSNNPLSSASLPTPSSPVSFTSNHPPEPTTPSPPLAPANILRPSQRSKPRTALKSDSSVPCTHFPVIPSMPVFNFVPDALTPINSPSFSETSTIPAVGTKRRHAMMMMLDATSSPTTTGSPSAVQNSPLGNSPMPQAIHPNPGRRRTKSTRGQQQLQNQNLNVIQSPVEAMDVEDDGRERKRVTRR